MHNDWFQFKKFRLTQRYAGMRISTDACIFGAWVANSCPNATKVLDVGTGTGLLTLQYLQKNPNTVVTALEPDENSLKDAETNFGTSTQANQIHLIPRDFQDFSNSPNKEKDFDLLICNPPFFQNSLKTRAPSRSRARHDSLIPSELISGAEKVIAPGGKIAVIYPIQAWGKWIQVTSDLGWFPKTILKIRHSQKKDYNRFCGIFERGRTQETVVSDLTIYQGNGIYTLAFQTMLKDYYLHL